jgi:hypothetical protein
MKKNRSLPHHQPTDCVRPAAGLRLRTHLRSGKALGDCVEVLTHLIGADKVAEFYTDVTGKDCGCRGRQNWLNEHFPNFLR